MRLLHWNIHMWRDARGADNRHRVASVITEASPDVVSLVEVDEQSPGFKGLSELATELGFGWVFIPTFEYQGGGGFGNALLTRRPMSAVQQWQLLSPRLYAGTEESEPRSVVLARVEVDDADWWVGSTHLPHSNAAERQGATVELLRALESLDRPWAVCGDFNQPPDSWLPSSVGVAPTGAPTYPTASPLEPIDYCIWSGATAVQADVVLSDASDHLPVLVEVTMS